MGVILLRPLERLSSYALIQQVVLDSAFEVLDAPFRGERFKFLIGKTAKTWLRVCGHAADVRRSRHEQV